MYGDRLQNARRLAEKEYFSRHPDLALINAATYELPSPKVIISESVVPDGFLHANTNNLLFSDPQASIFQEPSLERRVAIEQQLQAEEEEKQRILEEEKNLVSRPNIFQKSSRKSKKI